MGLKKITDLQLRNAITSDLNIPSDDGIQSYRVTAEMLRRFSSNRAVVSVNNAASPYTQLVATDIHLVDGTSGVTITPLAAASMPGRTVIFKKTDSTFGVVTLTGITALHTLDESIELYSDGASWHVLRRNIPSPVTQYAPTTTALGTPGSVEVCWQRDRACAIISGALSTGTTTGAVASIGLPTGLTSAAAPKIPTLGTLGGLVVTNTYDGGSNISTFFGIIFPNDTAFYVGLRYSSLFPLDKSTGAGIGSSNSLLIGPIRIPIAGWNG